MNEPHEIFARVTRALEAEPWFAEGRWLTSTHVFPSESPEALTFHVSKRHWYNEFKRGIHIESFLSLNPSKRKKTTLTLHILHDDTVPGTALKRRALSMPIVDAVFPEMSKWKGYRFRAGKYGMQPFALELDTTQPAFEIQLVQETTRLCRLLGPVVDKVLLDIAR